MFIFAIMNCRKALAKRLHIKLKMKKETKEVNCGIGASMTSYDNTLHEHV